MRRAKGRGFLPNTLPFAPVNYNIDEYILKIAYFILVTAILKKKIKKKKNQKFKKKIKNQNPKKKILFEIIKQINLIKNQINQVCKEVAKVKGSSVLTLSRTYE